MYKPAHAYSSSWGILMVGRPTDCLIDIAVLQASLWNFCVVQEAGRYFMLVELREALRRGNSNRGGNPTEEVHRSIKQLTQIIHRLV